MTAQNGAEAAAIYAEKKHEIAVVLTDMMMPVMDGSSLIEVLLRIDPAIKIVRTSGFYPNVAGNSLPEAGVKHFLTKPYTAETLLKTHACDFGRTRIGRSLVTAAPAVRGPFIMKAENRLFAACMLSFIASAFGFVARAMLLNTLGVQFDLTESQTRRARGSGPLSLRAKHHSF